MIIRIITLRAIQKTIYIKWKCYLEDGSILRKAIQRSIEPKPTATRDILQVESFDHVFYISWKRFDYEIIMMQKKIKN